MCIGRFCILSRDSSVAGELGALISNTISNALNLPGKAAVICGFLPLSVKWSFAIVLLAMAFAVALASWALAPSVQRQFEELSDQLPVIYENWKEKVVSIPARGARCSADAAA